MFVCFVCGLSCDVICCVDVFWCLSSLVSVGVVVPPCLRVCVVNCLASVGGVWRVCCCCWLLL